MSIFIPGGTRWACPTCKRVQLFVRPIPQEALPVVIKCCFKDCTFAVSYSTLEADNPPIYPKLGPEQRVQGNWSVEIQEAQKSRYWDAAKSEGQQISFRARSEAIAGHLAGGLECIESLKYDLNNLSDAMLAQFEGEWGMLTSFNRFWIPANINAFLKQPFWALRTLASNESVKQRTRLVLHPKFFVPDLGIIVPGLGGMLGQLVTPYSQFSFPVESWMAAVMDMPPPPQLRVAGDRIVGKHLFSCWADIPGTEPAPDHSPDAPSIRITNSLVARSWLATFAIPPWGATPSERNKHHLAPAIQYFESAPNTYHRKAWQLFSEQGRMAYFVADDESRISAWEFAMSVGAFGIGHKLCLINDERNKERYSALWQETAGPTSMSRNFHWKVVKTPYDLDGVPWESFRYLFVDFSDDLPIEVCESIANFNGRVILIHTDPVMDTIESNIAAPAFYACVNSLFIEQRIPGSTQFVERELEEHTLVSAILRDWWKS